MTGIDYDLLSGQSGGDPPDGMHDAYLVRAALVDTRKGPALVTEWQTTGENAFYWTTWFGFDAQRVSFTQDFLDAIEVDRSRVTDDDALTTALDQRVGTVYRVRTSKGAAWVNTDVEPHAPGTPGQTALDDIQIDSRDLPTPTAPAQTAAPSARPAEAAGVAPSASRPEGDDLEIPFHHEPFAVER